jgi:alkaline phosphatase D
LRSTPQLAIWDDHDFGYNDSDSRSAFKAESLRLFKSYWANPSAGSDGAPGIWFRQSYGGVDFFFLDGRYHRDPSGAPDGPGKTMLGAAQKAWLKRELRASRAPFKVLVSGGGWSSAERGEGGDSWAVYMNERNEIFDFIRDQGIEGVSGISGDSHMGELNCIPRSGDGGYDIYDFCSSPLAQMPATRQLRQVPEMRIRDVWSRSVNVGLLQFDMEPEPRLTYTLHDILGQPVWQPLILTPQDLRNGVKSWDRLADPEELRRLERHRQGRGYYGIDPS